MTNVKGPTPYTTLLDYKAPVYWFRTRHDDGTDVRFRASYDKARNQLFIARRDYETLMKPLDVTRCSDSALRTHSDHKYKIVLHEDNSQARLNGITENGNMTPQNWLDFVKEANDRPRRVGHILSMAVMMYEDWTMLVAGTKEEGTYNKPIFVQALMNARESEQSPHIPAEYGVAQGTQLSIDQVFPKTDEEARQRAQESVLKELLQLSRNNTEVIHHLQMRMTSLQEHMTSLEASMKPASELSIMQRFERGMEQCEDVLLEIRENREFDDATFSQLAIVEYNLRSAVDMMYKVRPMIKDIEGS